MIVGLEVFAWAILPYLVMVVFVLGLVWRYAWDSYGWTSKSSQVLERRWLSVGSQLFHWGFILVFLGHILGLVVPPSLDQRFGVSDSQYHLLDFYGGSVAGLVAVAGLVILVARRVGNPRVRASSSVEDYLTLAVLLVVMSAGLFNTIGYPLLFGPYDYRYTLGLWFRSLFTLTPNWTVMPTAPVNYQVHAILGMCFFLVFPFTRLVHVVSFPFQYLTRRWISYRGLAGATPGPTLQPPGLF